MEMLIKFIYININIIIYIMSQNNLFLYDLSKGIITYNTKNQLQTINNKDISDNLNPVMIKNNISLIEAQKTLIRDPSLCLFNFYTPTDISTNDVSRNTIGDARFFNVLEYTEDICNNSIIYKDKSISSTSIYTEEELNYQGDLDYIEFSIPQSNIQQIKQKLQDISSNFLNTSFSSSGILSDLSENRTVDFYFYIWQDINGPWYNGTDLSMVPNINQLIDDNNNIRLSSENTLNNLNDISSTLFYTYNYNNFEYTDSSSNYINVYKISGNINNNGMPYKSSIRIISPKYTSYNFLWSYKFNNCGIITVNNINYDLQGNFPLFTPSTIIDNLSYNNTLGKNISSFSNLFVERIIKANNNPIIQYTNTTLVIKIPDEDKNNILYSYLNRYTPDERIISKYLKDNATGEIYKHIYENNQIIKLNWNIYIFKNNTNNQQATDVNNNSIILTDNNINNDFSEH